MRWGMWVGKMSMIVLRHWMPITKAGNETLTLDFITDVHDCRLLHYFHKSFANLVEWKSLQLVFLSN